MLLAPVYSTVGGACGWLVFLIVTSAYDGSLPRRGDYAALGPIAIIAFLLGVAGATIAAVASGAVRDTWKWRMSWFLLGMVGAPIILIILIGWAMRGTGSRFFAARLPPDRDETEWMG
jgi:hypothetical protein